MIVICGNWITRPLKVLAITLWGIRFIDSKFRNRWIVRNHELIHSYQWIELMVIGALLWAAFADQPWAWCFVVFLFPLLYSIELIRRFRTAKGNTFTKRFWNANEATCFEQEAEAHEKQYYYTRPFCGDRKLFGWLAYLR